MLIDYEYVRELLELDIRDENRDRLILDSVYTQMMNYVNQDLELKEYKELVTVKDYFAILTHFPVVTVNTITDMNTNATVDYFTVDYKNRTIQLQPKNNNHSIYVEYTAGFTNETFPGDLKEALIRLFVMYKNDLANKVNMTETKDNKLVDIPKNIKDIFNAYSIKRL